MTRKKFVAVTDIILILENKDGIILEVKQEKS
jgi:hypothetical protein